MSDTYWLLDEAPAIPIDEVTAQSGYVTPTPGATTTLQCRFVPGDHAAETEPVITDLTDRYEATRAYLEHTDAVSTLQATNGVVYFRERLPPTPAVNTQFVKVRSPDDDIRDFWGVVVGGRPTTESVEAALRRLDLEIAYLAPTDRFADRQSARAELEA